MKSTVKTSIINSKQGIAHACRNNIHHPNRKCIQSYRKSPNKGIHVHDISYMGLINIHQRVVMANLFLPKDGIWKKSLLLDTCQKKKKNELSQQNTNKYLHNLHIQAILVIEPKWLDETPVEHVMLH